MANAFQGNCSREFDQGWKGLLSGDGGWLAAAKAINAIGQYLKDQGVNFGFGRYVKRIFHPNHHKTKAFVLQNSLVLELSRSLFSTVTM